MYLVCLIWAFKALKNYVFITYELVLSLRFLPLRKELCIACFTSELWMRVTDIFTGFDLQRVSIWIRGIIRILSATKGVLSVLDMGFQSLEKLCFHNIWTCAFLALLTFEERALHSMLHKWTVDACHGHLYRFWLATRIYLNQITFSSNSLRARPVALRLCL